MGNSKDVSHQCHIVFHPSESDLVDTQAIVVKGKCEDVFRDQEIREIILRSTSFSPYRVADTYWYKHARQRFLNPIPLQAQSTCMQDPVCSRNPRKDLEELKKAQSDMSALDAGITVGWVRAYHVDVPDPQETFIPSVDHPANDFIFRGIKYSSREFRLSDVQNERGLKLPYNNIYDVKPVMEIHVWSDDGRSSVMQEKYYEYDQILWHPQKVQALKAFADAYPININAALDILISDHPDISPSVLKAWFYHIMFHEGHGVNYIDNIQDFAASAYADSPFTDRIRDKILEARQTLRALGMEQGITKEERVAALPVIGETAWRVASYDKGIPLENQGYGLFQIIPGQVYDVAKKGNVDWEKYRGILSKSDIMNEDGSMNLKAILRAIYDPRKMFALQVLRYSETIKLIKEENPQIELPLYKAPHLPNSEARRTLALIMAAQLLISYPEVARSHGTLTFDLLAPNTNFANGLMRLYTAAQVMGIKLEIPGIEVTQKDTCTVEDIGWYFHGLEEGLRYCIRAY